jgi:hypothetical protein
MKRIAVAILLLSTHAANAVTLCQDTPGHEPGVHWSWREIEGKRCWFKSRGAMPPKSELIWNKEEATKDLVKEGGASPGMQQEWPGIRVLIPFLHQSELTI